MNEVIDFARKRPVLAALFLIAPLTVLFGILIPDKPRIVEWFHATGFVSIFAAFLLWLGSLPWEFFERTRLVAFARRHAVPALLALGITVSAFLSSPPTFRILADETNLMGTASAMYDEHAFYNPTQRTHYYEGMQNTISREWDKRPLFFPFMVYLAHSFLGYRETNGFVVNAICSFFLLFSFYLLLNRFFTRFLSVLGMIILAAFPLLVLWMTSWSFEIPNLLFGVLAFLSFERLTRTGSAKDAETLVFTLILLAQIRYESVLFLVVLFPVGAYFLKREEVGALSWRILLVPMLLLPSVWQRMVSFNQGAFQMTNGKSPFSFEWFGPNLQYAWNFFTAERVAYGTIPLVFYCSFVGLFAAVWWYISNRKEWTARAWLIPGSAITVFGLNAAILFGYYWGNLTLQYAMRLGLIFVPFMIASCVFLLDCITDRGRQARVWLIVGVCSLPIWYWSSAGANEAVREILIFREFTAVRRFLDYSFPRKDVVVISDLSNLYIPFRWSAVGNAYANASVNDLLTNLKNGLFQNFITVQRIGYADGKPSLGTFLDPKFELETLYETQYSAEEMLRISRVKHQGERAKEPASLTVPFGK
ncbi:MAG: glycosyltransferase family 39 protein [Candidatus Ozemobacteraceae bacterium]